MKQAAKQFALPFQQVPSASQIKVGEAFQYNSVYYLRIAPVKTLLRSTVMAEVVSRGDVFAVNIETGYFTVIPASMPVLPVAATFSVD